MHQVALALPESFIESNPVPPTSALRSRCDDATDSTTDATLDACTTSFTPDPSPLSLLAAAALRCLGLALLFSLLALSALSNFMSASWMSAENGRRTSIALGPGHALITVGKHPTANPDGWFKVWNRRPIDTPEWWNPRFGKSTFVSGSRGQFLIPLAIPLLLTALPTLFLWSSHSAARRREWIGSCASCGHDLTTVPARGHPKTRTCPDCHMATPA